MYVDPNFKTKKLFVAAVKAGQQVRVFSPGPFPAKTSEDGTITVEGPHFPAIHTWYARVLVEKGIVKKVLS